MVVPSSVDVAVSAPPQAAMVPETPSAIIWASDCPIFERPIFSSSSVLVAYELGRTRARALEHLHQVRDILRVVGACATVEAEVISDDVLRLSNTRWTPDVHASDFAARRTPHGTRCT